MTFSCRYFADGSQYGQKDFSKFMFDAFDDGYVTGVGNELKCSCDGSNMTVSIATGRGYIQGYSFDITDSPESLPIPTADTTYDRIDRIVARLSPDANKNITLAVLQGTASATPQPTALTRTDATWEISLAKVLVPHGSSFIPSGNVTDERDDRTVCGRANEKLIAGERIAIGTVAGDRVQKASTTDNGVVKIGYGLEVHNGFLRVVGGELKGTFGENAQTTGPSVQIDNPSRVVVTFTNNSRKSGDYFVVDGSFTVTSQFTLPYMMTKNITIGAKILNEQGYEGSSYGCPGKVTLKKDGVEVASYTFTSTIETKTISVTAPAEELVSGVYTINGNLSCLRYWHGSVSDASKGFELRWLNFTA